jgi:hypothetical protein
VHFAARDSATDTSAAFRKSFLLSAKKILFMQIFGALIYRFWVCRLAESMLMMCADGSRSCS